MAKAGRKVSMKSLDDKINKKQEALAKAKYETEKAKMAQMLNPKNGNSYRSYTCSITK